MCILDAYVPPRPSERGEVSKWEQTVNNVVNWLDETLQNIANKVHAGPWDGPQ